MKAIVRDRYGPPDVLELVDVDPPVVGDGDGDRGIAPVIDRRYSLAEVPEALRYLRDGRARGKIIITV